MAPRQFTLEEAESLLPRLSVLILELRTRKEEYDRFMRQVEELGQKMRGNGHLLDAELKEAQAGLEQSAESVNRLAEEVREMGCELKGIEEGLIDFRADMRGREVYLCWKFGEERIDWWHELDTGFAGRQPLGREASDNG
jgi:hypothetical protein